MKLIINKQIQITGFEYQTIQGIKQTICKSFNPPIGQFSLCFYLDKINKQRIDTEEQFEKFKQQVLQKNKGLKQESIEVKCQIVHINLAKNQKKQYLQLKQSAQEKPVVHDLLQVITQIAITSYSQIKEAISPQKNNSNKKKQNKKKYLQSLEESFQQLKNRQDTANSTKISAQNSSIFDQADEKDKDKDAIKQEDRQMHGLQGNKQSECAQQHLQSLNNSFFNLNDLEYEALNYEGCRCLDQCECQNGNPYNCYPKTLQRKKQCQQNNKLFYQTIPTKFN